ncbi:MAG: hypothetical protein B7Z10_04280 [Rhodobacterales bacterium 32-66-7]|nr:MAG: hypothetical protein B7Z31_13500 [Rhodobacterales bacterium 12-65-15]OYX26053.1 MAG: hypothetical protein B7Z10_04280 [Rhodobacterales bacterium 32-66-7]
MPKLVRLYLRSVVIGFGLAGCFTAGLVVFDVAGIGRLIASSDLGLVAATMLVVFNGIVFAAVQFGLAVMALADGDDAGHGGHGARNADMRPVPVSAARAGQKRR